MEVLEKCGLGFFEGGFSDEFGTGFRGFLLRAQEPRVLPGFKDEAMNVEFSKEEHCRQYGVVLDG